MTLPTTGVVLLDILIIIIILLITSGFFSELIKSISTSVNDKSKAKSAEKRKARVESEVNRRAAQFWERVAHRLSVLAIKYGVPPEEMPDMNPPTGEITLPDD